MADFVAEFTNLAAHHGMTLPPIIADDRRHRFCTHDRNKADRSGEYCLRIDGDYAVGWVKDYRTGLVVKYYSRRQDLSQADADRVRKKMQREKAKRENEARELAEKALKKSQAIWEQASQDCRQNPYVLKKKIITYAARTIGNMLIVPMYRLDEEKKPVFAGIQRIWPDKKRFIYGLAITGCFGCAGFNKDKSVIYVTEGYATGCTIHEATGAHVIVAFNSGNLPHVTKQVRDLYPQSQITIAADNDQWSGDAGIKAARQAAEIAGGDIKITMPEVFYDDPARPTDFNDIAVLMGTDRVKDMLQTTIPIENQAQQGETPEPEPKTIDRSMNWRDMLILKKDGMPDSRSPQNIQTIFNHHPALKGCFCYDEFADEIIVRQPPPWDQRDSFKVRRVEDVDGVNGQYWFDSIGLRVVKGAVMDGITAAAYEPSNIINPAKDYFETLIWDGKPRLDTWLHEWLGANNQPKEYLAAVGRKTIVAAVTRAFKAGAKFDHMLILESRQGLGKSTLLRQLATIGGVEYFTDEIHDVTNKDTLITMQGKLIVEFAELQAWGRSGLNDLKAFITRTVDEYRPPYGRFTVRRPRRCVFIGTVNPQGSYFQDTTGNRRYWPVRCGTISVDHAGFAKIVPQLWAEAYQLYRQGEQLYLSEDIAVMAESEQEGRLIEDGWTEIIEEAIDGQSKISRKAILSALKMPADKQDNRVSMRINSIMTRMGWRDKVIWADGKTCRGYEKIMSDYEVS
jgi:putative DNA primase/helicase